METKANSVNFDRGELGQVVLVLQGGGALAPTRPEPTRRCVKPASSPIG